MNVKISLCVAALLLAGAAQAQTVWRCGADGRSYSSSPCPEGRPMAGTGAPTAADVQAAHAVAARDKALAREMAQERREREREALEHGALAAGIKPVPHAEVKTKPAKKKAPKKSPPEAGGTSPLTALAFPRKPG